MKTMKTIYYGGDIITMEPVSGQEAVLVENGIIRGVGSKHGMEKLAGAAQTVNLEGKTLMPAFVDAHSHITAYSNVLGLAQLEGAADFGEIRERLKAFMEESPQQGQWVLGFGYDHNFLKERAHPNRELLDQVSGEVPILITHASGHMGVVNSAALRALNITRITPNPEGGVIGRDSNGDPNGYLEETAFIHMTQQAPRPTLEQLLSQMERAQDVYLSYGVTTVQDGLTKRTEWELLRTMAEQNRLKVDVACYVDLKDNQALLEENREYLGQYRHRLKIGGYKIFLDGSPQGRTAWVSRPYENGEPDYCGYPIYTDREVEAFFQLAIKQRVQLLVHCNGDAAAQQMIDCYEKALNRLNAAPGVIRPVMIHAQLVRADQLERMARLQIVASFFVAHTYYWGDIHLKNFGEDRGKGISPAQTAMGAGVTVTFHQDTPVLPPDMIDTIWCAVNRVSKGGVVMGENQRVSIRQALQAVTLSAAEQYGEAYQKGSIQVGKAADLIVLSHNPFKVPSEELRSVRVLQTIKDGKIAYQKK